MAEVTQTKVLSRRHFLVQSALVTGTALGASAWLAACGSDSSSGSSGPVTITVMDDDSGTNDGGFNKHWRDVFHQQNSNITIRQLNFDQQRLSAMQAAGTPPDIVKTPGGPEIISLVLRGRALDLTSYFAKSQLLKPDDLESVCDLYRWDGHTQGQGERYGMPHDWSQDGMYWIDTAVFDAAKVPYPSQTEPLSYTDLLNIGKELTVRQGSKIKVFGMGTNWDYPQQLMMMLDQAGQSIYKGGDLSVMDFTQPEVHKIFQWYVDWAQAHIGDSPLDPLANDWSGSLFPAKRYGMAAAGYWFGGVLAGTPARERAMLIPAPQWSTVKRISPCYGGTGWYISKGSKNPDQAWKFFEFYMGGPPAQVRVKQGWGLSPLKHLNNSLPDSTPAEKESFTVQKAELAYFSPLQFTPYAAPGAISSFVDTAIIPVMQGKAKLDDALVTLNTNVNNLLQQQKNLFS